MDSQALPIGYKLLWYEIKSVLGQGGFGITYLAIDANLAQNVAVKEYFPSQMASRDNRTLVSALSPSHQADYEWGLSRFVAEAQTLAQFRHPAIVPVYTTFSENQTAYMVMELITGESCASALRQERNISEEWILSFLEAILDGLRLIHERGFIHRDIKPDNIFMRDDHSPVLLDFGSARMAVESKTQSLTALVTPGFAPFEQYHTDDAAIRQGPWTDIYSLAATCYVGVAGLRRLPDALARINAMISGKPDPLRPAVEVGLGRFSERFLKALDAALRIQPEDRPQNVDEWLDMLPSTTVRQSGSTGGKPRGPNSGRHGPATNRETARQREVSATGTADDDATVIIDPARKPTQTSKRSRAPGWLAGGIGVSLLATAGVAYFLTRGEPIPPPSTPLTDTPDKPVEAGAEKDSGQVLRNVQVDAFLSLAKAATLDGRLYKPPDRNALAFYRQALELDPQNQAARIGMDELMGSVATLARRAIAQEELQDADELLAIITSVSPDHVSLSSLRQRLTDARETVEQAEQHRQLLAERVSNAIESGRAALAAGRLSAPPGDNALEYFQTALKLAPDSGDARAGVQQVLDTHLQRARDAVAQEDVDAAKANLATAAAINPVFVGIEELRGTVSALQTRLQSAAIADRVAKLIASAEQHRAAGRLTAPPDQSALQSYSDALALDPANERAEQGLRELSRALLVNAEAAVQSGAIESAQEQLSMAEQVLQQVPAGAELGSRLKRAQNKLAAQRALENRIRALLPLAAQDLVEGRLTQPPGANALERYREVLKIDPQNSAATEGVQRLAGQLVSLANEAITANELDQATQYLAAAAKAFPDAQGLAPARAREQAARGRQQQLAVLLRAGQAHVRANRLTTPAGRNALESFAAARELDPSSDAARAGLSVIVEHYLKLASVALGKDEFDQARAYLERAGTIATDKDAQRLAGAQAAYEAQLTASAAAERAAQAKRLLDAANADLAAGRLTTPSGANALERFQQLLQLDPNNDAARAGIRRVAARYIELAEATTAANDLDASEEHLAKAAQIAPDMPALALARSRLQTAFTERERQLSVERDRRSRVEALLLDAQADLQAGRLSAPAKGSALQRFRSVLDLEPNNKAARDGIDKVLNQHLKLAGTAISEQRFDSADAQIEAAAAIDADARGVVTIRSRLAAARAAAAKQDELAEQVRNLVAEALAELARAGDKAALDRAAARLGEASRLAPANAESSRAAERVVDGYQRLIAKALDGTRFDEAQALIAAARKLMPDSNRLADEEARMEAARNATKAAAGKNARVKKLLAQAEKHLAGMRLTSPSRGNAFKNYREILALEPDNTAAKQGLEKVVARYMVLADRALKRGNDDATRRYLQSAASVIPDYGASRSRASKLAAALLERREIEQKTKARAGRLLDSAQSHLEAGRLDRATSDAKAALAIDRGSRDANRILAEVRARRQADKPPPVRKPPPPVRKPPPRAPDKPQVAMIQPVAPPERVAAPSIDVKKLIGQWCGNDIGLDLTASGIKFHLPGGDTQSYAVSRYEAKGNDILVYWRDGGGRSLVFEFGRFAGDFKQVTQKRGKVVSESAWQAYNRQLRRCSR